VLHAGLDIGGTFTDLCLVEDGRIVGIDKALTTPHDPSEGVEAVLAHALQALGRSFSEVELLVHGTTIVTNAIIERRGSPSALLTTAGFRDSIEIGRERRYELYDLMVELPRPLVPRHLRFDVPERMLADGVVETPLDEDYVERLASELGDAGIEAVAISFLHAYANAAHEVAARGALLRVAPGLRVSISSDVAPELREYERTSTTIANVYVQALVADYLEALRRRLERLGFGGGLYAMLSSGGIATVETASRFPIRLLESGPAAGALAAAAHGKASGEADLLSFDMGGTTAKLCVVEDGKPLVAEDFEVDRVYRLKPGSGIPVKLPVIDMIEIGVGGGSIARVDSLGLLKVGPRSAGADPGPSCYGLGGTDATVTDADLVLGYLDPAYFLGGRLQLDVQAARDAIEREVAVPLGLSVEEAAWGIHAIVNENMANAARVHAVERGKDVGELAMLAFGGAGPVHAVGVASALGCPRVIAPLGAGVMSTVGFLVSPFAFDFVRSWRCVLDDLDTARAAALFAEMEDEGFRLLVDSGVAADNVAHARSVDMRYVGQGHEVRVPIPAGLDPASLGEAFACEYVRLYGREGPDVPVEAMSWRVVTSGPSPQVDLSGVGSPPAGAASRGSRQTYFGPAGWVETPVLDRYALAVGVRLTGPAIVEERESTLVVGAGHTVEVTAQLALSVTRKAA
jgi:N-methylhydantoinase A